MSRYRLLYPLWRRRSASCVDGSAPSLCIILRLDAGRVCHPFGAKRYCCSSPCTIHALISNCSAERRLPLPPARLDSLASSSGHADECFVNPAMSPARKTLVYPCCYAENCYCTGELAMQPARVNVCHTTIVTSGAESDDRK